MLIALWLILAAIFAHALLPVGSPMARIPGSAFSAATIDVALAPSRGGAAAFQAPKLNGPEPGLGGFDPTGSPAAIPPAVALGSESALAAAPAPPSAPDLRSASVRTRPYAPRAPPIP